MNQSVLLRTGSAALPRSRMRGVGGDGKRPRWILTRRQWAWLAPAASCAAYLLISLAHHQAFHPWGRLNFFDLSVYRGAARLWLDGRAVYGGPIWRWAPFTYPPFAALVFTPLALLPFAVDAVLVTVFGIVALFAILSLALRLPAGNGSTGLDGASRSVRLPLAVAAALWLEPITSTLGYGQINLLIALLVVGDLSRPDSARGKGALIGIAAGLKLTPLIFVPYLLFSRRRGAAYVGLGTFAATIAAGYAVLPADSRRFWTGGLFLNSRRVGGSYVPSNQSLRGLILRLDPLFGSGRLLAIALIVGIVGIALAVLASRRGDEAMGFSLCALTGLLVSPVSWTHHWALALPALLSLGVRAFRARSRLGMSGVTASLLVGYTYLPKLLAKPAFSTGRDPWVGWTLAAASYVLIGCAALVVAFVQEARTLAAERPRKRPARHESTHPPGAHGLGAASLTAYTPRPTRVRLAADSSTRVAVKSPALPTTRHSPPHSLASPQIERNTMIRLLRLIPISALSALALVGCGSSSKHVTGPSLTPGTRSNPSGNHLSGAVLHVGRWPRLHHTYRTIQAAVNAAHPGDRIIIAPGDYHESPNSAVGVRVTTPNILIEGLDRNTVIVDGTKPGAPSSCDPEARFQNFGPVVHVPNGVQLDGRNGIVIDRVSGVAVENLTVCNFVGTGSAGEFGNELWVNGGAGTGKTGLRAYRVANVTATSTYIPSAGSGRNESIPMAAYNGVVISNAAGPGDVNHNFASNMADSGFHIAGCPDCNAWFDHDTAIHNVIGFSAPDAGGRLIVEKSLVEHNGAGINLASEDNEAAPPPQDGACPSGASGPEAFAPGICTVIEHNRVEANNNADVSPVAAEVLLGAGIDIAGGEHDLVFGNDVSGQGSYGIVTTIFVSTGSGGFPHADCQEGRVLAAGECFYNGSANLIADNKLQHDGTFGNPTNGDLADATVVDGAPNCYRGNTDVTGPPTSAPQGLQAAQKCAAPPGDALFGVPGVQVLCAVRAFGGCHGGNGNGVLTPLAALSRLLHTSFDASAVRNTRAIYPAPGSFVAPRPAPQPSRGDRRTLKAAE